MRVAPKVVLTNEQRTVLQRWARGRTTPARLVRRAKIVLLASEGRENREIAEELDIERTIVGRWRSRFAAQGLAGIEKDAPRGGRLPSQRQRVAPRIVEVTTQQTPPNATHWHQQLGAVLGSQPIDGLAGVARPRPQAASVADLEGQQ